MTRTGELAIDVCGLRKVYRGRREVVAVAELDLQVERGEVFGLLGPNGAGKTTTVEICEGLVEPTAGDVRILGRRWSDDPRAIRQRIGVSLQETRPDARYGQLSGGQRQRLAVATALAGRPELLFLDEPTTGLDPQSRRSLWEVVRSFRAAGGTVLLTTHYMDEAAVLCDRLMIVDHGRQIALGTPRELIASLGAGHVVELEAAGLAGRVDLGRVAGTEGVVECELVGDRLVATVERPHRVVPDLLRIVEATGLPLDGLATRHTSLEDVFVHLTGRHLRDGQEAS
ncbi:MAG: ABC transporter ATP-binding protein [Planctomycetes bacterium]|nr:ABC transporter ATP-binding protein [Planctomycetota bacterium]